MYDYICMFFDGAPFLERWAVHVTAESNQIGPSKLTISDDMHGTVRNVAKHLTSHVSLSGGHMGWKGVVGAGHHLIYIAKKSFHIVLFWKRLQPHCHS